MNPDILVLFDLDHTLWPHDTDERWIEYLIEQGQLDAAAYEAANRDLAARYLRGEAGAFEYVEFYLSPLKARTAQDFAALQAAFMESCIRTSIPAAARELLARHRSQGHLTVLTTGTSRFLTAPIAQELGFAHLIATEPEVKNGRFTGRVAGTPNMREGKVERLLDWLSRRRQRLADFRESWFYSDSQNDLPLLSHVTHPVAVNADEVLSAHARQAGWRQISIG
jgi:HAD superfamily hydrolase (TIGR01490 family)